jgi:hypothetical protein
VNGNEGEKTRTRSLADTRSLRRSERRFAVAQTPQVDTVPNRHEPFRHNCALTFVRPARLRLENIAPEDAPDDDSWLIAQQRLRFIPNGAPLLKNEPHFVSKRQL